MRREGLPLTRLGLKEAEAAEKNRVSHFYNMRGTRPSLGQNY